MEKWVEIPCTDGLYFASRDGFIKSADRKMKYVSHGKVGFYNRKGRVLKQSVNSYGYLVVSLKIPGKRTRVVPVHKIIANMFIDNPQNKPQINHIDGNKKNNCVENLEWCTAQENLLHAYRIGLNKGSRYWSGRVGKNHCKSKPVIMLSQDGKEIKRFESMTDAAKEIGHHSGTHIKDCIDGIRKTCGGFKWIYAEG